ncbi:MAG: cytochrome-c peroxidase [Acidobacteria bacterium]|nr:cytochrome-c peroxidase [Acidobacteriota bacterium]
MNRVNIGLASALVLLCATSVVWLTGPIAAQDNLATPHRATTSEVELGRLLFWDPLLSGDRDVACATCHHPDFAYGDGRDLSLGAGAVGLGPARVDVSDGRIPTVKRNSPTILNTAFNGSSDRRRRRGGDGTAATLDPARAPMFWDSRVRSLETQALEPLKALEEMRGTAYAEADALDIVVTRLRDVPEYVTLFQDAFGTGTTIDAPRLGRAI